MNDLRFEELHGGFLDCSVLGIDQRGFLLESLSQALGDRTKKKNKKTPHREWTKGRK